jgi:hypothetical protein
LQQWFFDLLLFFYLLRVHLHLRLYACTRRRVDRYPTEIVTESESVGSI